VKTNANFLNINLKELGDEFDVDKKLIQVLELIDEVDHETLDELEKLVTGYDNGLQKHNLREEHWFIQKGKAIVTCGGQDQIMEKGDSIDIQRNTLHRISNYGDDDLVFIEIQTGDYFGEDDIERLEE